MVAPFLHHWWWERVHVPIHHLINVHPVFFLPLLPTSEREAYMTLPLVRCEYLLR
jgi:hypothetical protein